MHAAFHSVFLDRHPLDEVVRRVRAAGYDGLELNAETLPWARPHVTPDTPADARGELVTAARAAGLSLPAVGAHVDLIDPAPGARRRAIEFVNGCTDLAAEVGSPVVHILSGERRPETGEREAWSWFADAVAETAAHATSRGIALGVEAIAGHLFHAVEDYRRLWRDLPGQEVWVNFDPSHLYVQGEDPVRAAAELGPRVVHAHVKDGDGRFPNFRFPPLGRGGIDFGALVEALRRAGYAGALSVEYEAQVYGYRESVSEVLEHGRAFLRALGV